MVGDAANLATAVVQAPSISEDSSLPGLDGGFADSGSDASGGDDDDLLNINEARRVGVFADATNTAQKGPPPRAGKTNAPGGPPSNLSDLEDFDAPGIDDLADSRVEPRPILPSLPLPPRPVAEGAGARAAPPALPSMSEASLPSLSSLSSLGFSDREGSLNDDERAAMSGGVWDDSAAPEHPLGGATAATGATAGTAAEGADRGTGVRVRGDLSTSLSDLLGPSVADVDADDSVDPDNEPTSRPARRKLSPQPARAADSEADDNEPTAFRPPPAPMAAVLPPAPFSAAGLQGRSGSPRPVADPLSASAALSPARAAPPLTPMLEPSRPPPAHVSRSAPASELGWEDSTPRGRPPSKPAAPAQRAPGPLGAAAPKPPLVNAADDLYPEEGNEADDFEVATEGQRPGLSPKKGARLSDVETSELRRSQLAADAASVPPPPPPAAPLRPTPPAPARATSPTPVSPPVPAGASAPAAPPAAPPAGRLRAAPPPPEDDMTAPPSQESAGSDVDDGTHDLPVSNASSAEILDSAMVIRPAARATPLAKMVKPVADAASGPMGAAPGSNGGADDDDFMVDPDATMNLPARPKSLEGRARKPRAATGLQMPPPPASSVESAIEAPEAPGGPRNRRPPTEDMRRKARNLFELAQKDHAVGRIGAARMNAKLATIYDPDNEEFKRILEGWEDKPKGSPQTASSMARPEYVQLYEQAQDLEDEGDVDGALELLQRGVRMAPNPAAFHNRIGVILAMRKREFDRAAAEIEKAIGLEPDNPHYRSNLGKVMQKSSKRKVS